MKKIVWIPVLHIYQPPTQNLEIVRKIASESYERIVFLLNTYPNFKITIHIGGCLIDLLKKINRQDILNSFKDAIARGQIEIVGGAHFHPILPFLNEDEIKYQIDKEKNALKDVFGDALKLETIYLPEMAYSEKVGKIIAELAYKNIVLDEAHYVQETNALDSTDAKSYNKLINKVNPEIGYKNKFGMNVYFRNRQFSKTFTPEYIYNFSADIKNHFEKKNPDYEFNTIITAHDGELFGHLHKNDNGYYEKAFNSPNIIFKTISDYTKELNSQSPIVVNLREASWESTEKELINHIPFALWNNPKNKIHTSLWDLKNKIGNAIEKNQSDIRYEIAWQVFNESLASCAWWWASDKKLGVFSPRTWNPTEIEKGLNRMKDAFRSLSSVSYKDRMELEKQANKISLLIWKKHWKKWKKEN